MTLAVVKKMALIGSGYLELPQGGRRYKFLVERYRHDDGSEFGKIVSMEEIPDVGPCLIIPSFAARDADEAEHMKAEYEYEQANPHPIDQAWWASHREQQATNPERYRDWVSERLNFLGPNKKHL